MPTFRERTSTSSGAIAGTSTSDTVARRGSSKTSAFIRIPSSLLDQHLDLVRRAGCEARERAEPVALLSEIRGDVRRRRIEDGGDLERLGACTPGRIRLRDIDGGGPGGARAERRERTDRPGPGDQHSIARAHTGPLDPVGGDR